MDFINGENIALVLFFIGIYGVIARRNIVKSIISIGIMDSAVILFFLTINNSVDSVPPVGNPVSNMADPLPQALMITAIVIGVSITAMSMAMFIYLYHKYGTTNWKKARLKRMENKIQ